MAILNKPGSGSWGFSSAAFGANATPAPDSLFMIEETSGQIINSGKDLGNFDSDSLTAVFTGAAATGDSYLAFNLQSWLIAICTVWLALRLLIAFIAKFPSLDMVLQ